MPKTIHLFCYCLNCWSTMPIASPAIILADDSRVTRFPLIDYLVTTWIWILDAPNAANYHERPMHDHPADLAAARAGRPLNLVADPPSVYFGRSNCLRRCRTLHCHRRCRPTPKNSVGDWKSRERYWIAPPTDCWHLNTNFASRSLMLVRCWKYFHHHHYRPGSCF